MDLIQYLKFVLALTFVLGLIWLCALALRHLSEKGLIRGTQARRLKLVESLPLDTRRRLVLVRRDDKEHLIVLGPAADTVVETGITPPPDKPPGQ